MKLFEKTVLKDTIEINTTPEKIWEFFTNLETNYKAWHRDDHIVFRWTKGRPMESGSRWYAEEMVHGKVFKLKGTVGQVIPNRKIVFKYSLPISLVAPGFEWLIEPKGSNSTFTAISYLRAGDFVRKLSKKEMDRKMEMTLKHTKEEGENLKKLLENEKMRTNKIRPDLKAPLNEGDEGTNTAIQRPNTLQCYGSG
jgi:uncharacterized protein YndB with AHSA1/START domain